MKKIIGYTTGVFDLFHVGHLNIIEQASRMCDELVVGVSSDDLVKDYKGHKPIVPADERVRIVNSLSCVNRVIIQHSLDKMEAWHELKFNITFHGDDWKDTDLFHKIVSDFEKVGVKSVFFQYTEGTSSTILKNYLSDLGYF